MLELHSVRLTTHSALMIKLLAFSFVFLLTTSVFSQELKLPRLFSDHMVLQRDTEVRFWGWASPGEMVSISVGEIVSTTKVNKEGYWEAYFPKQEAGGPYKITVSTSSNEKTIEDVYFGDVWMAGGQSNMEWPVGANIDNMEAEIADSDYPEIRFFKVAHDLSHDPVIDLDTGEWKPASIEAVVDFSAVAWFFAKLNHFEKGVPVGIIDNNWGGTPAQAWAPAQRLLTVEGYEETAADILDTSVDWPTRVKENDALNEVKYQRVYDDSDFLKYGAHLNSFDDSGWENITLPNSDPLVDFVWLRKQFTVSSVENVRLSFGQPGKFTLVFINGTPVYKKIWSDDPQIIDIDKSVLKEGENIITIRTVEDWDNRSFIGKKGVFWIETESGRVSLEGEWKFSNSIEPPMPEVIRYEHQPGFLYNAMINPVAGYSIKGAIWYQGESNVGAYQYYNALFEAMIEEWRESWGQGDFPFLFVQLANFLQKQDEPFNSYWAGLRDAQTQTLSLSNTGMATIIDIGDADDVHPRNKQDVGYRLWQSARKVVFGEDIIHSGPMYRGHLINGNTIELSFDFIGDGFELKGSDKVLGFEIAGADKIFRWADAHIDGDKIIISSEAIANPVAVRYAWADNPDVSLYNSVGLPAVPFRTDDW